MVFPGNLQGRHIRETGPKGCILATVDDQHRVDLQFQPVDVLRWEACRVNIEAAPRAEAAVQQVAERLATLLEGSDGRPLAVRLELEGACPAHRELAAEPNRWTAEIQAAALQLGGDRVWVEQVVRNTSSPSAAAAAAVDGPLGELCQFLQEMQEDADTLQLLSDELKPLHSKLPAELAEGPLSLRLDDPNRVRQLLQDAQQVLIQRIHALGDRP
jgi:hypothetical protein